MLRLTFAYGGHAQFPFITKEFCDEKVALASELREDEDFKGMNFYHLVWEADDLVDFSRIFEGCGEICDDPACGPFA